MKRTLATLSCLLLITSTALADTGVKKIVKSDATKAIKDVKTHKKVRSVKSYDDGGAKQAEKYVTRSRQKAAPVVVRSEGKNQVTPSKPALAASSKKAKAPRGRYVRKASYSGQRSESGVCQLTEMTYSPQYGRQLGGHLGRGFLNVLSGWVELPRVAYKRTMDGPPVIGLLTGITEGAAAAILRTASGLVDIPSGLIPGFTSEMYYHREPTIGCILQE